MSLLYLLWTNPLVITVDGNVLAAELLTRFTID